MSSAFPSPDHSPVDPDSTTVDTRASRRGVSPAVVRGADMLRLAFLACYVMSATVSQVAASALIVYLISG